MAISVLLLSAAVLLNWLRYRDPLYPAFAQSAVWMTILWIFWLFQDDFDPLHVGTLVVIVFGVVMFGLGSLVTTYGYQPSRRVGQLSRLPSPVAARVLVMVTGAALPFILFRAYQMAMDGPTELIFLNLRYAMTQEDKNIGYGLLTYIFPLAFFSAALQVMLWRAGKNTSRTLLAGAILLAFAYGVLSTGRGILIGVFVTLAMIPIVLRQIGIWKSAAYLFAVSLIFFVVLGWLMGKGGNFGLEAEELFLALGETFSIYLLSSISAFDHLLQQVSPLEGGLNSFRTLFALLHAMGFDVTVRPLVQDFVEVPYSTNVYTLYQPYFQDFGILSLPLMQFVFGLLHGAIYRAATDSRPHPAAVYLYALSFWPLLGQFGSDAYLSLLSQWIQYLTLCGLFMVWWAKPLQAPGRRSHE